MLTAWFNNAGVGDDGTLSELSEEAVRRLVEVNLLGTLWGMRAAIAAFGEAGGDIVNTASLAGLGPVPGYSVYAATKAAIVSVSMSGDAETPRRIRVHALCPDGVQTAMLDGQTPGGLGNLLVHSGGPILTVDQVADAAVGLLGSRRVVRAVPGWRGGLVRVSALAPSVAKKGTKLFAAQGRRAIERGGRLAPRPRSSRSNICSAGACSRSNTCSTVVHMFDRTSDRSAPDLGSTVGGHG